MARNTGLIATVAQMTADYELIQTSQDIAATLDSVGLGQHAPNIGCLFVRIGDGDYVDIWALIDGITPWVWCEVLCIYDRGSRVEYI